MYGVVTQQQLEEDPSFWVKRATEASKQSNETNHDACSNLSGDLSCGGSDAMYSLLAEKNIIPINANDIMEEQSSILLLVFQILCFILLFGIMSIVLIRHQQKKTLLSRNK